jgi:hypothetical protein
LNYLYLDSNKEKLSNLDRNFQELWNTIKRPNLRTIGAEEESEICTKGLETPLMKL